jgi:Flp pilus assembly pilin Flp
MFHRLVHRPVVGDREEGQTTAEYALVILGAAAVATLLITCATKSHAVGKLFDEVIGKVLPG